MNPSHGDLEEACASADTPLQLDFVDVLDLLQAAGLIRVQGAVSVDPVEVRVLRTPSAGFGFWYP